MKKHALRTPPAKTRTGVLVATGHRTGKEDEGSVATKTCFGAIRTASVLPGSPNFGVTEDPLHAAARGLWRPAYLCGPRRFCDHPSFLMPRGGLLFWVLVSILLSIALTVVLNLLLFL